eukprot:TRINITY_DN13806_c0_g1_i6.p1 TRINITY_DN13806_c0_g1~~TRINITY_DN13806_c0_g1_i6.p1  ORF type:complete len:334 (-),score=63.46 TRINITY_DN13806_c0_g1_i6:100-1101(-)
MSSLILFFFFLMIRRPPRSTLSSSSAASDVYKRQGINAEYGRTCDRKMASDVLTDLDLMRYVATSCPNPELLCRCALVCTFWRSAFSSPVAWTRALEHALFRPGTIPTLPQAAEILRSLLTISCELHGKESDSRIQGEQDSGEWLVSTCALPTMLLGSPMPIHPLADAWRHKHLVYFEVIVCGGASVGLSRTPTSGMGTWNSHVGWRPVSYGYHSDDGSKWRCDASWISNGMDGVPYGPAYGDPKTPRHRGEMPRGDVVGCGLDKDSCEVFFTLNGAMLGVAFTNVNVLGLRPAAVLHLSLIHISEPTRLLSISYAVFCLKKKKKKNKYTADF